MEVERKLGKNCNKLKIFNLHHVLQVEDSIRCLKEKPAVELLDQLWSLQLGFLEFPLVIVSRDRNFFRDRDAFHALRTKKFRRDVNLMIGINHDEGIIYFLIILELAL